MSATPWRGTLIFAGGIAAIAATAVTRFAGADATTTDASATPVTGSAAGTTSAPPTAGSSSGSSGGSSSGASSGDAASSGSATAGSSSSSDAASSSADPAATPSAEPTTTQSGTVTVVGSTVQTRYGAMQVSVTFDGEDVTDVQALQYPSLHRESEQINAYAIPVLVQEAVAADSATIDTVSGATISSDAFRQSLQSAIDQHG